MTLMASAGFLIFPCNQWRFFVLSSAIADELFSSRNEFKLSVGYEIRSFIFGKFDNGFNFLRNALEFKSL